MTDSQGRTGEAVVHQFADYGDEPTTAGPVRRLTAGNGTTTLLDMSADGEWVLATTYATDLGTDPKCQNRNSVILINTVSTAVSCVVGGDSAPSWPPVTLTSDGAAVYYTSGSGDSAAVRRWDNATGATSTVIAGARLVSISHDGSVIAYVVNKPDGPGTNLVVRRSSPLGGAPVETVINNDASLAYALYSATLSADGRYLAYLAAPVGSNLVDYIRVRDLETGNDRRYGVQTDVVPRISGDGSFIVSNRYAGSLQGGIQVMRTDNGVVSYPGRGNAAHDGIPPWGGSCIAVQGYSGQRWLTDDPPNKGLSGNPDEDMFTYDVSTGRFRRATNVVGDNAGVARGRVSNGCALMAIQTRAESLGLTPSGAGAAHDLFLLDLR